MAFVKFTSALKRFFPELEPSEIPGRTVSEVIDNLNKNYPGIGSYILEEDGSLRKHVNIFVTEELINDRNTLSDSVQEGDEVLIYQALSGG